jgi:hypothetical protein
LTISGGFKILILENPALLFWNIPGLWPVWLSVAELQREITIPAKFRIALVWIFPKGRPPTIPHFFLHVVFLFSFK